VFNRGPCTSRAIRPDIVSGGAAEGLLDKPLPNTRECVDRELETDDVAGAFTIDGSIETGAATREVRQFKLKASPVIWSCPSRLTLRQSWS